MMVIGDRASRVGVRRWRSLRRGIAAVVIGACIAVGALMTAVAASADATSADDDSTVIVVDVIPSVPSPTPTPTVTASSSATPATPASGATRSGSSAAATEPTVAAEVTADDGESGPLSVSGLDWRYEPDLNPLAGSVTLRLVVRNRADVTIDSVVAFRLTTPFGGQIGEVQRGRVLDLAPGETRTVTARIDGVGLWALSTGSVDLVPVTHIDGARIPPIQRDALVAVLPWLFAALLIIGLAAWLVVWLIRTAASVRLAAAEAT